MVQFPPAVTSLSTTRVSIYTHVNRLGQSFVRKVHSERGKRYNSASRRVCGPHKTSRWEKSKCTLFIVVDEGTGQRLEVELADDFGDDIIVTGESTPGISGYLEVIVNGKLIHSKKNGDGYIDSEAKLNKIKDAIAAQLK